MTIKKKKINHLLFWYEIIELILKYLIGGIKNEQGYF
jgi:hypothetical protein